MQLMSHDHVEPLFCGVELAARIERAEANLIVAGTVPSLGRNPDRAFVTSIAGGFACFAEDGAPFNKVVGLGFGGLPGDAELEAVEAAYKARVTDEVAQLAGAATAVEHRRRGVQTALLAARLTDAKDAGCDIAVVTTAPGSKSQHNVQRQGFDLLYTRALLVRDTE